MKITKLLMSAGLLGMFALFSANASAMIVTFGDYDDANGASLLFDISATETEADAMMGGDPNKLLLGLDMFAAGGATGLISALDTHNLTIAAPAGYKIVKIRYDEGGSANAGGGVTVATGSVTVNGDAQDLLSVIGTGNATGPWTLGTIFDVDTEFATVSVTNSLFAFGGGDIFKDFASITVEVALIPLPAPLLLMGSALAGLFVVRRRSEGEVA